MLRLARVWIQHKLRGVLSCRNNNLEPVVTPLTGIVLLEPFPQMVGINPYHGIKLRIKFGIASKHIHADAVFFELVTFTTEILIAEVGQQTGKLRRALEYLRSQHACKSSPLLFLRRLSCGFRV